MKRNWTKIALALGPMIMISTYVWEYARTKPAYTYLVQPWSIRGFDTIHGEIFVVAAVLLLVAGMLTASDRSMNATGSAVIVAYVILASVGFAMRYVTDDITLTLQPPMNVALSVLIAGSISLGLRGTLGESVGWLKRALPIFIPLFIAVFLLFRTTLVDTPVTITAWGLVLITMSALGAISMAAQPLTMGANRMIILSGILVSMVVMLSAGAIRQSLIDIQLMTVQESGLTDIAASYKDTQAAPGWWLAGFGAFVFWIGAVGLWANRRDIVAALARAKKQRAAAEQSAKEIQDAAEAYARDYEGAGANSA